MVCARDHRYNVKFTSAQFAENRRCGTNYVIVFGECRKIAFIVGRVSDNALSIVMQSLTVRQ